MGGKKTLWRDVLLRSRYGYRCVGNTWAKYSSHAWRKNRDRDDTLYVGAAQFTRRHSPTKRQSEILASG
jgi:hypothetical protein